MQVPISLPLPPSRSSPPAPTTRNGLYRRTSFIGAMPLSLRSNGTLCKVALSFLDSGKDRYFDCAHLAAVFGQGNDRETCTSIVAEIAPDGRL